MLSSGEPEYCKAVKQQLHRAAQNDVPATRFHRIWRTVVTRASPSESVHISTLALPFPLPFEGVT
jgi:hypothetical protein